MQVVDKYFSELNLSKPDTELHEFDMLAPVSQLTLPGFNIRHYTGFSTILLTDLNSREHLLMFLLIILSDSDQQMPELYGSPYSAVELDNVLYTEISSAFARHCLEAHSFKLM